MGSNNVNIPKCEDLQYGNQERNPKSVTSKIKDKKFGWSLKRNQLEPGKLFFSYQYESRLPGRVSGNILSKITSQVYKIVTIFCYEDSSNISVHNQV